MRRSVLAPLHFAFLLAFAKSGDLFSQGLAPVDTGAAADQLTAAACRGCHAAAHDEWAASRHGRAWTNPTFQREYRTQKLEWCVHCHAPLREQLAEVRAGQSVGRSVGAVGGSAAAPGAASVAPAPSSPLAAEGVGCASCHLRAGRMLATRQRAGSPHDTEARADFGSPSFCAGCHQFNFPLFDDGGDGATGARTVVGYSAHPMQDTVAEHARGPRAATGCRDCHATSPGGHAYPGGHDPAMLTRAVRLDVCRERGPSASALRLTVANVGAGHQVPTGDLHRHLVLRAWRPGAPERLHETVLGRRFEAAPDGGKRTVADNRVPPGGVRAVTVPIPALGPRPRAGDDPTVRVELRLVYTIDEFPFPGHELAEPTYTTIITRDLPWPNVPRCPVSAAGVQARLR